MAVKCIVERTLLDYVKDYVESAFGLGVDRVEVAVAPEVLDVVVSYFTNEGKYDVSSRAAVGCEGGDRGFANGLETDLYVELKPKTVETD